MLFWTQKGDLENLIILWLAVLKNCKQPYYSGNDVSFLTSTELLVTGESQWTTARSLPSRRYGHTAVTLGNRLIIAGEIMIGVRNTVNITWLHLLGGYTGSSPYYLDEMLEWDPSTGNWKEFGKLSHKRDGHAMSVVDLNDVEQYCA